MRTRKEHQMNLSANCRRLLTVTGLAGIGYALSWIAGLSIPAPMPKITASGDQIATALAGHGTAVAAMITASGVAYLLLLQNLANLAIPAGVLLLVFITGTGITLGTSAGNTRRDAPAARAATGGPEMSTTGARK